MVVSFGTSVEVPSTDGRVVTDVVEEVSVAIWLWGSDTIFK